jgi:tetratricopeptide (TPR) repeat protein
MPFQYTYLDSSEKMASSNIKLLCLLSCLTIACVHVPAQYFSLGLISPVFAKSLISQNSDVEKLLKQADSQADQGNPDAALQTYQQALALAKSKGDRLGEGNSIHRIGSLYLYDLKSPEKARPYYQEALEIAQSIPNPLLEAKALLNFGNTYKVVGDYKQSIAYHEKSLAVARKAQSCQVEATALEALGYDTFTIDLPKATQFLENARDTLHACKGESPEATQKNLKQEASILTSLSRNYSILNMSGAVNRLQGDAPIVPGSQGSDVKPSPSKGIQTYQQAIEISKKTGDRAQEGVALIGLADMYKTQGNYPEAESTLEKAVQVLQKAPTAKLALGKALVSLVEVYGYKRQWTQVVKTGRQALVIMRDRPQSDEDSLEYQNYEAQILIGMADANRNQQQYPDAIENYTNAANVSQNILALADTVRNSRNKNWVFIQATNAKIKRITACTQLMAVYVISGQTRQTPAACQSKQP